MRGLTWRWYCRHIDELVPLATADCPRCATTIQLERARAAFHGVALAVEVAKDQAAAKPMRAPRPADDLDESAMQPPRTPTVRGLTIDQEDDLRGYFGGLLEVVAGCRSPLGSLLDRMKYQLPRDLGAYQRTSATVEDAPMGFQTDVSGAQGGRHDAEDKLIEAMGIVARQRTIRAALRAIEPGLAGVLRVVYSPIPEQLVVGLVSAFDDRETAAVAMLGVHVGAPGASKREVLRALIERAKGDKRRKIGPSEKARAELDERRTAAKMNIRAAVDQYVHALRDVQRRGREASRRRFEMLVAQARMPS